MCFENINQFKLDSIWFYPAVSYDYFIYIYTHTYIHIYYNCNYKLTLTKYCNQ